MTTEIQTEEFQNPKPFSYPNNNSSGSSTDSKEYSLVWNLVLCTLDC